MILIETYWNVNTNLNISIELLKKILIETYWNVNGVIERLEALESGILIETYWNVNEDLNTLLRPRSNINRDILECKLLTKRSIRRH